MNPKYQPLFQPYTLNNGVTIKNRFTVAPLTIYDSGPDGEMTDAGRRFWHDRFEGFGLYIMPFTNVHPSGIGFESPNAFDERHLPTLREYADMAHAQGAKAVVQIAHSGLRADPSMTQGHEVIAPTGDVFGRIRTMTAQEITDMVGHYAYAAELVLRAGFDGVEIHGANGWQIQQFFSAATNLRQDEWGGSLEKRMRFPLAIVDAIDAMRQKHQRPDFIIGYRFSPEEPGADGITMKETLALVDALLAKPLQYLHISLWDFYKKVRRGADPSLTRMQVVHDRINGRLPFFGSGNLYTADDMLKAYQTGWVESVSIGKSIMLNPQLIKLIENGRENEIETAFDWEQAEKYRYTPAMLHGTQMGTDFYPPSKQNGVRYISNHF
ncbi:NADH-dependent flavin oxidoreductase [Avibacterium gallinarum]|uniref:2,4-dienoyl-CoA reductase-like NADH-dependent reductase (Old Yellow Enzyme family) n=1 Tax=Avibacterium gallinarum TaxID=755 RepID=A0A379AXI3_AVIGA|nr:NADH-dependent flavin oxidoreductase [Avibacterium gallinarum]POY43713.1 NADH-dependent flavin oxidoreductase [Avibacterium gallinarum]TDP27271.1 2,4-dienoyl-CoA reductase-like NADH-dependent reductase (Old Yellow Enzyme family) [Avibacterium gallinarum]SUB27047.1 NADH oxidase [Avibacterium gallinarum]